MNENIKVPEGWKRVRLGEIVTENSKSPFKVEEADNEGSYPFFTSGEEILKHSKYLIDDENIFISTGGAAYVNYYNGKSSYSADTYSLKSKINTLYLYYFLYRRLNHITFRYFIGSGLEHLQKQYFKNSFEVIFPIDFKEQQKIAEILETVDRAIEKTDKIIEKYKRIKQGLMQDLLTKGIDENGKIRSEKTHKFKDSPLGRIPEEWEVVRLGEVGKIVTGSTPPTINPEYYGDVYQFITPEDIQENKYINSTQRYLSPKGFKIQREIPPNCVCVVCIGSTIGKVALTTSYCSTNQQINTIIPNELLYFETLYYLLLFYAQDQLKIEAGLQALPIVNKKKFSNILIPLPPLPEQQRIAEILSQIDNTIEKEEAYKQKLEHIKKGLMEDLLTGKVRVNKLIKEEDKK
jgi:type I restriction enzyme S subunit